jgi:hypothetical protein
MVIFVVVVVAAAVVYGVIVLRRGRETVVPVAPAPPRHAEPVEAWPEEVSGDDMLRQAQHDDDVLRQAQHDATVEDVVAEPAVPAVRWSRRFDPTGGALDDAARLALIRDLGFVRGGWCVPLLAQAYEEEQSVEHRRAVVTALAAYRHPDARPTMEAALASDDEPQRTIAAAALEAIEDARRT